MPYELTPFEIGKSRIARELFVFTADDNYITARWCFSEALNVDYFWLAVHLLEKYFKAILLINGGTSKNYSHNILKLYHDAKVLAGDLLIDSFTKPSYVDSDFWKNESVEEYLIRLHDNGNEHNRYQIFGHDRYFDDLFKLDQLVFSARRLCRHLDGYMTGKKHENEKFNIPYRTLLTNQTEVYQLSSSYRLEKVIAGKCGDNLQHALLNLNFPFIGKNYAHSNPRIGWHSKTSVLATDVHRYLQSSDAENKKLGSDLRNWVLEKIQLPKDALTEIKGW